MSYKDQGNEAFKEKDFTQAIHYYTQALVESPDDHTIIGNRSAAYYSMK